MAQSFKSKEKILVHLLDNKDFYDHYTKPMSVTQGGISERTDLRQNTISYALKDLKGSGFVEEKTSRVKGKKQRMKTYFLTDEGEKKAKDVCEEMKESPVDIHMYGEEMTVKAKNVNDYIPSDLHILDIILEGEDGGIKFKMSDKDGTPVKYTRGLPTEDIPTDLDIAELEKWYRNGPAVGLLEENDPVLLAAFTDRLEDETNIFHFRVRPHKRPIHIWDSLSKFLEETGRFNLSTYREFAEWLDDRQALEELKKDLQYTSALMIFDGLEYDQKMKDLISDITEEISGYRYVRILLTGGKERLDLDRDIENASEIEIEKESERDVETRRFSFENGGEEQEGEDLEDMFSFQLEFEVSLALSYLSVFRGPVKKDELLRIDAIDEEKLRKVVESSFITRCGEETLTVPRTMKKKKREMMSESTKRYLHYLAAIYYKKNEREEKRIQDVLERLYHLFRCEEIEEAISILKERGSDIISGGYSEPLLDILSLYEDKEEFPEMIYYEAEAQRVSRSFEESRKTYKRLLEISGDEIWKLLSCIGLGKVAEKLGGYEEAISYLNRAEEIADEASEISGSKDRLGKIYVRRGEVWNKIDEYDRARKDLKRAIEVLLDEEDQHLLTSSYFILARMERSVGEIEDAIEPFKLALKSWSTLDSSIKDRDEIGQREVGTLYSVLKELGDADVRIRSQYSSESAGPIQEEYEDMRATALLSLAECHMEDGSYEKAIKTAEDARGSLLKEDKVEIAFTEALLGRAYLETGRHMKAQDHLSKAIFLYSELDQPYKLGLTYYSMAKVKEKTGDPEAVEKHYRKAVLSLSRSGAEQDAEKVKREIESIPISL